MWVLVPLSDSDYLYDCRDAKPPWESGRLPENCMISVWIAVHTNVNASLIFGLATPIELYTFDWNLPDSQANPPWKYIEMFGISLTAILTKDVRGMEWIL